MKRTAPPDGDRPLPAGTHGASDRRATEAAIATVWRLESARVVAVVARLTHDLALAEDMAQDALVAALEHWPRDGVPDKPGAWLTATAKRRALDLLRHRQMAEGHHAALGADLDARGAHVVPSVEDQVMANQADPVGDDLLRLIFTTCHPVLSRDAQVALTLKLLGGLSTAEIARAFLVSEPTLAQRLVRAKRTLGDAKVPFELPLRDELAPRLGAVLEVVYLIFNEGYAATAGDDWMRPTLCDEALRLARMLVALAPAEPEVLGLQALLEIQASRAAARVDAQGEPVLLADQDRSRWDRLLIRRGLAALARGEARCAEAGQPRGPYLLQAALAACHARAARAEDTDWPRLCTLYDELLARQPSPVVALNRAVAVGRARGPAAALPLVQALEAEGTLAGYHLLPCVMADLLERLGRNEEARAQWAAAAERAGNARERAWLLRRAGTMH